MSGSFDGTMSDTAVGYVIRNGKLYAREDCFAVRIPSYVNPKKLDTKFARYSHQRQEGLASRSFANQMSPRTISGNCGLSLHACRTRGPCTQIPPGKTVDWLRSHILGKIQHLRWLNEELEDKYLLAFQKIAWGEAPQ